MQIEVTIFITALIIMTASLAGVLFVQRSVRHWMYRNLAFLVSFSAGVFLVTALLLVRESLELLNYLPALGTVVFGFVLFWVGQLLIPESHHHHSQECDGPECPTPRRGALRMLIGDGIHNIGDGIVLVPAFIASPAIGFAAAASIFIHELLQEISEYFVLRSNGYTQKQALKRNFIVSSTILIGVVIGFALSSLEMVQGVLLGVTAGGFLFIVFHDLIPHRTVRMEHTVTVLKHLLAFLLGIAVLFGVSLLTGHGHEELDEEHGVAKMEIGNGV